jgi:hypothetical protein
MNKPHTTTNKNFSCMSHDSLPLYSGTIALWLCSMYNCFLSITSGFCHKVDENCTLLGYYAASSGNLLLMFSDNLSVTSIGVTNPEVKMGPIGCPEMLVRNYHYMLHDTEECNSQQLIKSQPTPHKEHTVTAHRQDSLSQVYCNLGNPDMTSPVTMATCLISSYVTYGQSLTLTPFP